LNVVWIIPGSWQRKLLDNVCALDENYKVVMLDLSEDVIRDGPVENGFLLLGVNKTRLLL
jgi:hypothetical protein